MVKFINWFSSIYLRLNIIIDIITNITNNKIVPIHALPAEYYYIFNKTRLLHFGF